MDFLERLRGEHSFSGPAELVAQIRKDIESARAIAAQHGNVVFRPVG